MDNPNGRASQAKRIMVVEDEFVSAMELKRNLLKLGYEVLDIVVSGEEAVRQANELLPDLILMDITLNGPMDGIQAATEIKKSRPIPIVYLTAHVDTETLGQAEITEPSGYLPKPCTMSTIATTIKMALYKSEADAARKKAEDALKKVLAEKIVLIGELQAALDEIKTLRGILPICCYCKNIRNEQGYWEQVEAYITRYSKVEFSHSICLPCMEIHHPEEFANIMLRRREKE